MRAWKVTKAGRPRDALVLDEAATPPEPGPGTLQLEVLSAGIGLPDALMCQGSYLLTPALPFTQGQEVVGRISAVGPGIEGRQIGDRMMAVTSFFTGDGSFAQKCLALDDFCLPVPEDMTDAEGAAFLIPLHTAYIGLIQRGALQAGENLLVVGGAGGTGSAAIQVGKAVGARVITTASTADKARFCESLGADVVIQRDGKPLEDAVLEATDGHGADVIYDPVGGDAYQSASRCVAHEGRILMIGFASGSWGQVETPHMVQRNYSAMGVIPSGYDRAFKERAQEVLVGWWKEGRIRIPVEPPVAFEDVPEALERLLAGGVQGKLTVAVSPEATAPDPSSNQDA